MTGKTLFEKIWETHIVDSPLQEAARRDALTESGELGDDNVAGERHEWL